MSVADIYGWAEAKSYCELNQQASRQHIKNNLIVNGGKINVIHNPHVNQNGKYIQVVNF